MIQTESLEAVLLVSVSFVICGKYDEINFLRILFSLYLHYALDHTHDSVSRI